MILHFSYPGEWRAAAVIRRIAIGCLPASALVWLAPKSSLDRVLLSVITQRLEFPPETSAVLIFLLGIAFSFIGAIKALEFHLFPHYDAETLLPIGHATGLLNWHKPARGPVEDSWSKLSAWATTCLHDGRWGFAWTKPLSKAEAFRCAILCGANGIGKSQLVREFALTFSRKRRMTKGKQLAAWRRRVWLWSARLMDDPWHTGIISASQQSWRESLTNWLPAAPTLLILDDPTFIVANDCLALLQARSKKFWYPVRLLVVDQFVPYPLKPAMSDPDSPFLHQNLDDLEVTLINLQDVRWDGEELCHNARRGFWYWNKTTKVMELRSTAKVKLFWKPELLEPLCKALDGNPLMLAEAARWLAAGQYRTVAELMRVDDMDAWERELFPVSYRISLKERIGHRITMDRAMELVESHLAYEKEQGLTDDSMVSAVILSSLAGRLPIPEAPKDIKKINTSVLGTVLPIDNGAIAGPGAWPIAEAYVRWAVRQRSDIDLQGLVVQAYRIDAAGTERWLKRKGWLAERVWQAVDMAEAVDKTSRLDCFNAAAVRALYFSRNAVLSALRRLDALLDEELAMAQEALVIYGVPSNDIIPDIVVALLLLTRLGAKRFPLIDLDNSAWISFTGTWDQWLGRCLMDMRFVPANILGPLRESFRILLAANFVALRSLEDTGTLLRHADLMSGRLQQFPVPLIYEIEPLLGQIFTESQQWIPALVKPKGEDFSSLYAILVSTWRMESLAWRLWFEDGSEAQLIDAINTEIACIEGIVLRLSGAGLSPVVLATLQVNGLATWTRTFISHYKIRTAVLPNESESLELSITKISVLADRYPENFDIQRAYAEAWAAVAFWRAWRLRSAESTEDAAAKIDSITKTFDSVEVMQYSRAFAWRCVVSARALLRDQRAMAESDARIVENISKEFPYSRRIQRQLAETWRFVCFARNEVPEQWKEVEDAAMKADDLAKHFVDDQRIQQERSGAWYVVADSRVKVPAQRVRTEEAVQIIDEISGHFPDYIGIHESRANAWLTVAMARRDMPEQRAQVKAAVDVVDEIARCFPERKVILLARTKAWGILAEARAQMPDELIKAEDAARIVDSSAAKIPNSVEACRTRSIAWTWVCFARCQIPEQRALAEEVARIVDDIAKTTDEKDLEIYEGAKVMDAKHLEQETREAFAVDRADCWAHVAWACATSRDQRDNAEKAARTVEDIAKDYSENWGIQQARALAWRWVAYAYAEKPDNLTRINEAARIVKEIAAAFPRNAKIQEHLLEVQRTVSEYPAVSLISTVPLPNRANIHQIPGS